MIHVTVRDCTIEEVDSEICVVAGCALGFVAPHAPPHVLHVEDNSVIAREGVEMDDVLSHINDKEVATMQKADVVRALLKSKGSSMKLSFAKAGTHPEEEIRREPVREMREMHRSRSRSPYRMSGMEMKHKGFQPPPERPPMWWDRSAEQNYMYDAIPIPEWERRGRGYCPLPPRPMGMPSVVSHNQLSRPPPGVPSSTIVAERVPEMLLSPDVVENFFSKFGTLSHVTIDKARKQAVVDFVHVTDAERAVASNEPILGDSMIYLRFFRGQRPPHQQAYQPLYPPQVHSHHSRRPTPAARVLQRDNMVLETPEALGRRKTREDSLAQKKELMQKITDKMKVVMTHLTDSNVSEDQRDQLQDQLMNLKKKLTFLTTPKVPPKPAQSNVLDLRSKTLRVEFKNGISKEMDATAALKEVCPDVNWALPEMTLMWEDTDEEKHKSCLVTFGDRRSSDAALMALPKALVTATYD